MKNTTKGFFKKEEIEQQSQESNCIKCKLYKGCQSPRMKVTGEGKKKILIIAEAPGKTEDEQGIQLVGEAGKLLRRILKENNINLDKDCWKTNIVQCRPSGNRTPTKREITLCRWRTLETIKEKKPHLILLSGTIALQGILQKKISGELGGINKWRGFVIPDQSYNAWIAPIYHPSYILRSQGIKPIENLFKNDTKQALRYVDKSLLQNTDHKINILDTKDALVFLTMLEAKVNHIAFDYETTGLKPFAEGHEIVCCAISHKENEASVFELNNRSVVNIFKRILKNKEIKKSAHNIKFEHQWSRNILKVVVKGWDWDTQIAAHVIDNRAGITGLKFLAYVNFGQEDYSSHLDKYIKCDDGNGFNRIKEAPLQEVMIYCAIDAIVEFKLMWKQKNE